VSGWELAFNVISNALNAVASLIWTLAIGLGSYLAGPAVADALGDVGIAGLVALIALAVISGYARRRMHRRQRR
jgi:membrane protein DedA with SNARE-associated domain